MHSLDILCQSACVACAHVPSISTSLQKVSNLDGLFYDDREEDCGVCTSCKGSGSSGLTQDAGAASRLWTETCDMTPHTPYLFMILIRVSSLCAVDSIYFIYEPEYNLIDNSTTDQINQTAARLAGMKSFLNALQPRIIWQAQQISHSDITCPHYN